MMRLLVCDICYQDFKHAVKAVGWYIDRKGDIKQFCEKHRAYINAMGYKNTGIENPFGDDHVFDIDMFTEQANEKD